MKRGVNQLEMVLAFVIFIAAVSGSIFFLQTFRAQHEQFANAEALVDTLLLATYDTVTITPFLVNQSALVGVSFVALPVSTSALPALLITTNGSIVPSDHQQEVLIFNPGSITNVLVLQSSSLVESEKSFPFVADDFSPYTQGASTTRTLVTLAHLQALQQKLESASSATLSDLGLPATLSVSISFSAPNITLTSETIPPGDREVRTVSRRIEVLTEEGSFIFGTVQITLW